jgi:CheY-like chemotaxis protein
MPRHTILVADDEESDVLLIQLALKRAGLPTSVVVARSGREAVGLLAGMPPAGQSNSTTRPELLLLDLKMPYMDGFEVLSWLATREDLKDLPVIVFTSSADDADRQRACRLGAREYLVKPNALDQLVRLLVEVHGRYLDPPPRV